MKTLVVYRDLKGLRPGTTKTNLVALELAATVTALTDVSLKANRRNEDRRAEKDKDKDIGSLFPESKLDPLGRICQVPPAESAEDALSELFSNLANKKKNNSNHSIFQQVVDDIGVELKIQAPVIPLSAVTALLSLKFGGIDTANLGSGILVMTFIPPGAISPKSKAAMLALMTAIQSAGDAAGNMIIPDSVALFQAGGNGYIPLDFTKSDVQVKSYLAILCAMLGLKHVLVNEYYDSRDYIKNNKIEFQQALIDTCGAQQAPAM